MSRWVNRFGNYLKQHAACGLYPATCVLCHGQGAGGRDLCDPCRADLERNRCCCVCCAEPMAVDGLCGRCQQRAPRFERAIAPFRYAFPMQQLIGALKFGQRLPLAPLLGELLLDELLARGVEPPDCLLPVPLHRSRMRERGFNQAVEIARPLARHWHVPVDIHSCRRVGDSGSLKNLHRDERRKVIRGVFELDGSVRDRRIVIVDDVITTGSTANEMARLLKRAGAQRVEVWAVARTGGWGRSG